ncbi:MAG TPA: hypothetical protein VD993_11140 [Chitinophagaceae bacterium]|nr:hypothetical protein [Chitinophagaceae bacterium]
MTLLPNEQQLIVSNAGKIILTNLRIFMKESEGSGSYIISIFLEKISSVESRHKTNPLLGLIGTLLVIVGLYLYASQPYAGNAPMLFIITGVILIILYYATRKHVVTIASDGGRALNFEAGGISEAEIEKFLTDVQDAKLKRITAITSAAL